MHEIKAELLYAAWHAARRIPHAGHENLLTVVIAVTVFFLPQNRQYFCAAMRFVIVFALFMIFFKFF